MYGWQSNHSSACQSGTCEESAKLLGPCQQLQGVSMQSLHASARAGNAITPASNECSCEHSDHATQRIGKHSGYLSESRYHSWKCFQQELSARCWLSWCSCVAPLPAPLQDKAQLHKIGGGEQGRCYEDDECILPDSAIEATCHFSVKMFKHRGAGLMACQLWPSLPGMTCAVLEAASLSK